MKSSYPINWQRPPQKNKKLIRHFDSVCKVDSQLWINFQSLWTLVVEMPTKVTQFLLIEFFFAKSTSWVCIINYFAQMFKRDYPKFNRDAFKDEWLWEYEDQFFNIIFKLSLEGTFEACYILDWMFDKVARKMNQLTPTAFTKQMIKTCVDRVRAWYHQFKCLTESCAW